MTAEFSVVQFFANDDSEVVASWIEAADAVLLAYRLVYSVGGRLGTTRRVIITDGGDYTTFCWEYGKGVTFPPPPDGRAPAACWGEQR